MIFGRTQVAAPAILTSPGSDGLTGRAKVTANFGPGGPGDSFKYEAYSDHEVKDALLALLNDKYAYCETKVTIAYYSAVEHSRSKGKIKQAIPKFAGLLLAGLGLGHLLFACNFCNSQQYLKIYGSDLVEFLGKMDQFPLHNFNHIIDHLISIATEEPRRLLINPCRKDPEILISYGDEGNIIAKRSVTGFSRLKVD